MHYGPTGFFVDSPVGSQISGIESAIFRTTTELDWVARRFIITSVNETFSSRGKVIETCIFSVRDRPSISII